MKQIITFVLLVFGISFTYAQTTSWTGYLADQMCSESLTASTERAASHTKECLIEDNCAKTGYGVIVEGKWYKFDKKGDELAAALLSSTQKDRGIKVAVTGKLKKNKINVTGLTEAN
jgi:hypothetical protein